MDKNFDTSKLGFIKCLFKPDYTTCDKCNKSHKQLYYRRISFEDGEYYCYDCILKEKELCEFE